MWQALLALVLMVTLGFGFALPAQIRGGICAGDPAVITGYVSQVAGAIENLTGTWWRPDEAVVAGIGRALTDGAVATLCRLFP